MSAYVPPFVCVCVCVYWCCGAYKWSSLSQDICVAFYQPASPSVRVAVVDTCMRLLVSARACVRACERVYARVPVLQPI